MANSAPPAEFAQQPAQRHGQRAAAGLKSGLCQVSACPPPGTAPSTDGYPRIHLNARRYVLNARPSYGHFARAI